MKRRVFGTVERLPSKRYRACCKHEGRAVYAQRTFATKADASGWPANTETDLGRGTRVDPRRGQEPFHQYAGTWMIRSGLAGSTHVAICLGRTERRCANIWLHAIRCRRDFEGVAPLL